MRVLVADDDRFMRHLLVRALESFGHEVVPAVDGLEALELFQKQHFPLLVVDWVMPKLEGPELCKRIRELGTGRKYTYIIMLTSFEGKQRYLEAIVAGADDFLTKPFDRELLAARLHVAKRVLSLEDTNRKLSELIPICMYCKKARNDKDYWKQLDQYLLENTETRISHGICPECYEKQIAPKK